MLIWIPVVGCLFLFKERHTALILSILIGYLFLPQAEYKIIEGIPKVTKLTLIGFSVCLFIPWKFPFEILNFKLRKADLPMLIWCLVPIASSISNGLGVFDGVSAFFIRSMEWGVPYFIGRLAFDNSEKFSEVEKYLFIGGLIYVPLCLYEIKMSPQLHNMVYGFQQHSFAQTFRMGGFRPTVFLYHGLAVALWMMASAVCAFFHLAIDSKSKKTPLSFKFWAITLIATFFLCKSAGSWLLFFLCVIGMYTGLKFKTTLVIKLMLFIPLTYIVVRSSGSWDGANMVELNSRIFGEDRAESLAFRLMNENLIIDHVMQRNILGWGGWGRANVIIPGTEKLTVVDGLWLAALGANGYVGLAAIMLATLIPFYISLKRYPPNTWHYSENSAIVTFMFIAAAYSIDNLLNNMPSPYFLLGFGALTSQFYKPITQYEINEMKQTEVLTLATS